MELDESAIQLLDTDGVLHERDDYPLDLSDKQILEIYELMSQIRSYDLEAVRLQRQGQLNLWCPVASQEAAQVGSASALRPGDRAFPQGREFGVGVALGLDPADLSRVWKGETLGGGWDPRQHIMALYTFPIGSHGPQAVGYAMGLAKDGLSSAVICYLGDGAFGTGDAHEALNWATVFSAPVVFFCQNNQWAISVPFRRQSAVPIFRRAAGFGLPGVQVDGNDVLACHAVSKVQLARARDGGGPALIEALTYRIGPHTTSDDATRYRSSAEEDVWIARDPIDRLRKFLIKSSIADEQALTEIAERVQGKTMVFREECLSVQPPEPEALFENTYVDPPQHLIAERRRIAEFDAAATEWSAS